MPTAGTIPPPAPVRLSRSCGRWRWATLRLVMLSIYFLAGTSGSLLIGAFNARDDPKSTLSGGPLLKFLALAAGASQVLRFVYMLVVARQ